MFKTKAKANILRGQDRDQVIGMYKIAKVVLHLITCLHITKTRELNTGIASLAQF